MDLWLLPAVLSGPVPTVHTPVAWRGLPPVPPSWRRTHAFDLEVGVTAGIVFARLGFSPGEFVDFVLGWFGADIAGDDR